MIVPSEAQDWARARYSGIAQPPTGGSNQENVLVEYDPDTSIISPTINGYIGGTIEIKGNARGGSHRLEIGQGLILQSGSKLATNVATRLSTARCKRSTPSYLVKGFTPCGSQ